MRIIVCIKQISHIYARTGMNPARHYLAPVDEVFRINPYDELAMGMALHTRDLAGGGEITLLTLGPLIAEAALRRCLAMGADNLYQIDMDSNTDPWQKSGFLARAIKDIRADLVLCGKESLDSRNGQVGALLGHHLGVPFVSCIRDIAMGSDKGSLEVQRSGGRGIREVIACPLPAVFSVDLNAMDPPLPTYEEKRRCRSLPVRKLVYDRDTFVPKYIRTRTSPPRARPKTVPSPDSRLDSHDRIGELLSGSLVEKKGEMLTGDPESQVEGIISFLDGHGFLETKKATKE